jgi:hypothetical protein
LCRRCRAREHERRCYLDSGTAFAQLLPTQGARCRALRCGFGIFLGAGATLDDLSSFDELIAERVITIGMGIHELADVAGRRHRIAHCFQHRRGERKIEQRVDEQGLIPVAHETRIVPAPGPWCIANEASVVLPYSCRQIALGGASAGIANRYPAY